MIFPFNRISYSLMALSEQKRLNDLIWVFQIPPRRDSTPNDWGTSRPAFTAYGAKIQAIRFVGGR
jgi:hypothetical protein